jgi:hypothetical protein
MPDKADIPQLSSYLTACETLAESLFSDLSPEKRAHTATWSVAIIESLRDEDLSVSDLHLLLGTLAGVAVHEEETPEGVDKEDLRNHARNLMIGAFERGCDGIPLLDFKS